MSERFIEQRRQEVIDLLTDAFARDIIETSEYEYRVGQANALNSIEELNSLVRGLSDQASSGALSYPPSGTMEIRSVFSSQRYQGDWLEREDIDLRVMFGEVRCDFRRSLVGPVTRMNLRVFMGEVKIIVPPGVKVRVNVSPVLGEVSRKHGDGRFFDQVKGIINSALGSSSKEIALHPNSHPNPVLEIRGKVFMGSVVIIEKDPSVFE